jgi:hypothetical protein
VAYLPGPVRDYFDEINAEDNDPVSPAVIDA